MFLFTSQYVLSFSGLELDVCYHFTVFIVIRKPGTQTPLIMSSACYDFSAWSSVSGGTSQCSFCFFKPGLQSVMLSHSVCCDVYVWMFAFVITSHYWLWFWSLVVHLCCYFAVFVVILSSGSRFSFYFPMLIVNFKHGAWFLLLLTVFIVIRKPGA